MNLLLGLIFLTSTACFFRSAFEKNKEEVQSEVINNLEYWIQQSNTLTQSHSLRELTGAGWNEDSILAADYLFIPQNSPLYPQVWKSFTGRHLVLNGAQELTPEAASHLSSFEGESIFLNDLHYLDQETAAQLSTFTGLTHLEHCVTLIKELHLNGITALDPEVASALTKPVVEMRYGGKIILTTHGHILSLDALSDPTKEVLEAFTPFKGEGLYLNGIKELNVAQAEAIAGILVQEIRLNGLTDLNEETARALAKMQAKKLELSGLQHFELKTAEAFLQENQLQLSLTGLKSIETKVLELLAGHSTVFQIDILFPSTESLRLLKNHSLRFNRLNKLSLTTAHILVESGQEHLYLNGVRRLKVNEALILSTFQGDTIHLNGLNKLKVDAAESLASFQGEELHLNGLTSLDPSVAAGLSGYQGNLFLNGLKTLSFEAAEALAQFSGKGLFLEGLQNLSEETALGLASMTKPIDSTFSTVLYLRNLQELSPVVAAALSGFGGDMLNLQGLQSLDVETAKALQPFKNSLSIPLKLYYQHQDLLSDVDVPGTQFIRQISCRDSARSPFRPIEDAAGEEGVFDALGESTADKLLLIEQVSFPSGLCEFKKVILTELEQLTDCYNKHSMTKPDRDESLMFELRIEAGNVVGISTDTSDHPLALCLHSKAPTWTFPKTCTHRGTVTFSLQSFPSKIPPVFFDTGEEARE